MIYRFKDNPFINNIPMINSINNRIENNSNKKIKFYFKEPEIFFSDSIDDENLFSFDSIETPAYFEGYFQFKIDEKNRKFISERFFNKHNDLIHKDLQYLPQLTEESQQIANDMKNSNSILLHVRHGDYVGLLDFGLCSEEYYEKSIEIIASKVDNPKFFIFSDDIEGAKKLKIDYPHVFIDFKENKELNARGNGELLKLMSSCKHFIIANSSLSWWASFLGENDDKIIITPEPWSRSRRIMSVETIDNKKPIKVINNDGKLFNDSKKVICKLNGNEFTFKNINFNKNGNSYKIKNIKDDSCIIFNNKKDYDKRLILKISIESNHFNCFRVLFKTKDKENYCNENTFNVYYYDGDDFEQYLLFPKDAMIEDLKIIPGNQFENEDNYVTIKSLEIRELN